MKASSKTVKRGVKSAKAASSKKAGPASSKSAKPSGLRAAAERLKKAFSGKKAAPSKAPAAKSKPQAKPKPAAKPVSRPAAKAPVKTIAKPMSKMHEKTSSIVAPKGLLSEAQLRRMSERDYMNEAQLSFFRHKLLEMRQEVLDREVEVKERLHEREVFADPADRATAEEEHWLDLRLRERESLLLRKIDDALRRIEAKEFGWCEKTGDAIGIPRLLARPTATVCVDVKGQDERVEAQFRDR